MSDRADNGRGGSGFVDVALKLLGAVAGLTALTTFAGGAVLWAHFNHLGLPADQIMALLPKQLLLTVGAREMLPPVVIGAVVAGTFVAALRAVQSSRCAVNAAGTCALITGGFGAIVVVVVCRLDRSIGVALVGMAIALAVIGAVSCATDTNKNERVAWTCLAAVVLVAALFTVVRATHDPRMEPVAVLLDGSPRAIAGFYVGQTSDRLYIVPLPGSGADDDPFADQPPDRILELRRDKVVAFAMRAPVDLNGDGPGDDEARNLLADLSLAGVDPRTIPVRPVATLDPVATFAPLVNLHVREQDWPMPVDAFLRRAWLMWTAPGCVAWIQGQQDGQGVVGQPDEHPELMGRLQLAKLTGPDAYAHVPVGPGCTRGSGTPIAASDHTRPWDKGHTRPPGLPIGEGWALHALRNPQEVRPQIEQDGPQKTIRGVPVYYQRSIDGTAVRITYWFFYGFSESPGSARLVTSTYHEGDWERMSVLVRRVRVGRYLPRSVTFQIHDKRRTIPWQDVARTAGGNSITQTHPLAYSALGSHATYWRTGDYPLLVEVGGNTALPARDEAMSCSACPQWDTWQQLVPLATQPWYGFGGAWGDVGDGSSTTGPLGPSSYQAGGANPSPTRTRQQQITPLAPASR